MQFRTNFNRFKEPRGFIKVIQFVIAILAFATTGGYYSEFTIGVTAPCTDVQRNTTTDLTHNEIVKFSYPFQDIDNYISGDKCTGVKHESHKFKHNYKSESEFFVFVGVVSFLYCIVALVYYVVFEDPAKYGPGGADRVLVSFASVDFVITVILALFWFASSCAWAAGLSSLKDNTDATKYIKNAHECKPVNTTCKVVDEAGYTSLTISVLFGFLCCFLWCANIWFVYKETVLHKEPGATETAEQPAGAPEIPRQQVPKEEEAP